jgi:PQQ-dependent dehydrogenase (methanol/ethanol family)
MLNQSDRARIRARIWKGALCLGVFSASGCSVDARRATPATQGQQPHLITEAQLPAGGTGAAIEAAATAPEDGQWIRPAKDFASSRYSGLTEINTSNVGTLQPVFQFNTGTMRGQEAAPLVIGSTMYVVTPYPNLLYALDLTKQGAPVKWTYNPKPQTASQGEACCDVVNRGPAYADGKIIYATLDNNVVAVDTGSGAELWRTKLGDIGTGQTMTMAPLIVKDRVLVGNSGGEMGVRGWVKGLDLKTGAVKWTALSTGPDSEVLIGSSFKPFYSKDRGTNLGVQTWPGTTWQIGGGGMWGWISYDPTLDLVFYGTSNPGPWNPEQRPGDNKWTSTLFARRPETGEAIWAYQMNPHDLHDYDGVNESLLLDIPWHGSRRGILLHPDRNGYMYAMDRATGEVLYAKAYVHITSSDSVNVSTGELVLNETKEPKMGRVVRDVCPGAPGGKDWQPSAFSPRTGLVYVPHQNICMDEESTSASYIAGTPYVGMNVRMKPGIGGNRGFVTAWDPVAAKPIWRIAEPFPVWSGALVTAGDVMFYGTMEGWLKAVDARTGALLWKYRTSSGIIGQPIAYRGPDGKEYIAVLSGVGGWSGAIVAGNLDPLDSTAALGFVNVMHDLPTVTAKGGTLYVFAIR